MGYRALDAKQHELPPDVKLASAWRSRARPGPAMESVVDDMMQRAAPPKPGQARVEAGYGDLVALGGRIKTTAPPKRSGPVEREPAPAKPDDKIKHEDKPPACGEPLSVRAVISGGFLDKLAMEDYYPKLAGKGSWAHGGTAGPWDTGTRCGVNAQLVGIVDAHCRPDQYQFQQTVTHTKSIINGKPDSDHGTSRDDIAASGGDYSKPPLRQERTVGGEIHISMADPPSLLYSAVRSAEWDRTFLTTLTGPTGKKSARWSISTIVGNGKVTKNTVT